MHLNTVDASSVAATRAYTFIAFLIWGLGFTVLGLRRVGLRATVLGFGVTVGALSFGFETRKPLCRLFLTLDLGGLIRALSTRHGKSQSPGSGRPPAGRWRSLSA